VGLNILELRESHFDGQNQSTFIDCWMVIVTCLQISLEVSEYRFEVSCIKTQVDNNKIYAYT
jgi:hypothetical protein